MFINILTRKTIQLYFFSLILLVCILHTKAYKQDNYDNDDFIDVGVRLTGNSHDSLIADLIAEEREVINNGLIDGVDLYHFRIRRKHNRRSKRAIDETIADLKRDERVKLVTIGEEVERQKRGFLNDDEMEARYNSGQTDNDKRPTTINDITPGFDMSKFKMPFNDVLYHKQWYIENEGQMNTPANHDINIAPAWLAGYSGKGVTICIIDDGVDHRHPDLIDRYQPQFSYDLNDLNDSEHDPMPRTFDSSNNHGTRCAGTAAGKENNGICGVGSAYGAFIAGIRLLDGRITTLLEARALTLFSVDTHIKSASWGPTDDGTKMEAPGALVNVAMDYAITHGRHGKGTVFVWASGNGGAAGDDCGADGYVSHQYVISIGSLNHLGKTTYFDEFCPSTMAVAYTGGRHARSIREQSLSIGVVAADVDGKCTTNFFGTSAAAPVAAGTLALVLEANPELGYRDVMYIIAETARIPSLSETDGWVINGAGYHVNDKFGFGVLDAGQMTALAQKWTNVQPRYECYHELKDVRRKIGIGATVEVYIDIEACVNITMLEHVTANISYSFHRRGDVKITIISPSKTPSEMLSYRKNDATDQGIKYFPFMSAHHWGEPAIGRWTLRIETLKPQNPESEKSALINEDLGELGHFGLRFFGTHSLEDKTNQQQTKRSQASAFVPTTGEIESIYKRELSARETPNVMQKRDYQNLMKERQLHQQNGDKNVVEEDRSVFGLFRRAFGF